MGASMRQSGVLAAAGIYALENNLPKLKLDMDLANQLAEGTVFYNITKDSIIIYKAQQFISIHFSSSKLWSKFL